MQYCEIVVSDDSHWVLSICDEFADGTPLDIWAYTRGELLASPKTVPFYIDDPGPVMDFNLTAFGTIVVSACMADIVRDLCKESVQFIPATIEGNEDTWMVMNVLARPDCIDFEKSVVQFYPPDHPERAGEPRGMLSLVIDARRTEGQHLFRPADWMPALIVSEVLRRALENGTITGLEYWRVDG